MPYLHLTCRRYLRCPADLKDALQDSFVAIFRGLDTYDPRRALFKTWSNRVAINVCLRHNERRARRATGELILPVHEKPVDPAVYARFGAEELIEWLRAMPADYLAVFNAHVIDGFSHAEIARLFGIDVALSRQRLSRARRWLKKNLPAELDPAADWGDRLTTAGLAVLICAFAFSSTPSIDPHGFC